MGATVLHETTTGLESKSRNGYSLTRTYALGSHKVRVTVDWDTYAFQTRLYSEVWTPNGWTRAVYIAGEDPEWGHPAMASPYGLKGAQRKSAQRLAEELLERTARILGEEF